MSLRDLFKMKSRRRSLRRFSPERAKLAVRAGRSRPLDQGGEKLIVALVVGLVTAVLIGLGTGLGARGWTGLLALVGLGEFFFVRYLLDFRRSSLASLGRVAVLAVFLVLPLLLARLLALVGGPGELAFLPLSFVSVVLALSWNRAFALDCTIYTGALLGLFVMMRPDWELSSAGLAICLAGALTAALAAQHIRRRMAMVRVGILVGLAQMLVAGTLLLLNEGLEPAADPVWWMMLLGLEGIAVGLVTTGSLPAIEALFGITTDISLLELGNTHEQPLLRKLLLDAPGTFHHSYIVGLISEAATEAVGGNALLARVGSLYHDIGKMNKPGYFAENAPEATERHKDLTPEMSTLIIAAHPRDGVELGQYYGLPNAILDFMPEHHGTSCIEYFYHRAQKLRGEENVNEESFRYPGPRPQSIETAIVMIADAVEAISRQMPDPTRTRLEEMVHKVAMKRLMDRQFDECGMTLKNLERIEQACVGVLVGIYHTRPTFPKGKKPHPLDLSRSDADREEAPEASPTRADGSPVPRRPAPAGEPTVPARQAREA